MQFILGILFLFFANISAEPQTVLLIRHDAKDKEAFFKIDKEKRNWLIPISPTGVKESYNLKRFLDLYFSAKGITTPAQYADKVDVYVSPFRRAIQTGICWANTHGISMKVDKAFGEIKKKWGSSPIWHDDSDKGRMNIDNVANGCKGGKTNSLVAKTSNGPLCDSKIAETLEDCDIKPEGFAESTAVIPGISTEYYNKETKGYLQKGKKKESDTEYQARANDAYNVIQNSRKQFVVVFAHGSLNIEVFKVFSEEFKKQFKDQPADKIAPHIRINPANTERAMPTATITFYEKENGAWKWDGERFPIKFDDGDGKEFARLGQAPCQTLVDGKVEHVGIDTTKRTDAKIKASPTLDSAKLTYFDADSNAGILSFTGHDNGICKYDFKCTEDDKKICYVTGYVGLWTVCKKGGSFVGVYYLNMNTVMSGYDDEALKSTLTGIDTLTPPTDCPAPASSENHVELKVSNQKPSSEWTIPCMILLGVMLIFLALANLFGHSGSTLEIELLDVDQHLIA